jgi:hypothetical protein
MGGQHRGDGGKQQRQPAFFFAATFGRSMLVLSGLILAGSVIALTVATPVLVIFSPVLVPAAIVLALMAAGFITSGGLGVAALSVFSWMYKYLTGKHPLGADQLDHAKARLATSRRRRGTAWTRPSTRRRLEPKQAAGRIMSQQY